MTAIRYVGPSDSVDIPALGVTAVRGEEFDAPADVAKSLLSQSAFEQVKNTPKKES